MPSSRSLIWIKWIGAVSLTLTAVVTLFIALSGWNWLREPVERMALEKTGRELRIGGDIKIDFAWPRPLIRAGTLSFANPAWSKQEQMVSAEALEISIDLSQLLDGQIVLPEVRLLRPQVSLEQGSNGQKNWLLDLHQQDETARIEIGRLLLDQGTLSYDNPAEKTSLRATLSATDAAAAPGEPNAQTTNQLAFAVQGQYKGLPLKANGTGGPVLGLRDETTPYPLTIDLSVGRTIVKAAGTITSLLKFTAVDLQLTTSGQNLAQLYPLLGIIFPATPPYKATGHFIHSGKTWRFEDFSGRIGNSDLAGSLQVETGGQRPALKAELTSRLLDMADLGPAIGAQESSAPATKDAAERVLPELPFKTDRWRSVDAEVSLQAKTVRRASELPLEDFNTHLSLRDAVLTLNPLKLGIAGGQIAGTISLDGRADPIKAHAELRARKIILVRLFPSLASNKSSIGQLNGEIRLAGSGNSVRRMLASANGKVGLVVIRGEISRLTMEKAGLHLWEIAGLTVSGDKSIKVRCGVADLDVKDGTMNAAALIFDTEVTTLIGTGSIDLAQEKLNLRFNQKTKSTSPLALRSPLYVRGSFAHPEVGVDKGQLAARALGALALGLVNPLLTLLPLIDAGPGADSDCRELVREARALPHQPQQPHHSRKK